MQAPKHIAPHPYSRDSLLELDRDTLVDIILSLDSRYQQLADYVRDAVTSKYGRKTERFETPGQLLVFPATNLPVPESEPEAEEASSAQAAEPTSKTPAKDKKPGHARRPPPATLARVPVIAPPPAEVDLPCPCCGAIRVADRKIYQNWRYQFIPATFYVEDLYSVVYACPNGHDSKQLIARVPEPIEHGSAASGLLAQIAVARDFDHQPFNRQSSIYARSGVPLNRSTLSDLYAQVAVILLPLYTLMHQILLQSKIISTDDTPVKVLDRSKEKNIKTGRKWAYLGDEEHPVNLFDYTCGRGRDGPLAFLKNFKGLLQGDCFSGNLAICAAIGTTLVACLAHARRYFIKAMLNYKDGCNQALLMFQALYEIERTAKELGLSTEDIKLMRKQEAVPLLDTLHGWLQKQYTIAQPKSAFAKALFYCLNNWNELTQYVKDGELKIDNNHCEREMKYVAMGKKAWLFFGSDQGGKNHAIVASVLSTCRRHGVEPWAYLTDVIQRLTEDPNTNLEELLPYNWKQKFPLPRPAEIIVAKDTPKVISGPSNFANAQPVRRCETA